MTTIIIFIIILSLLVFVHELGHFAVAKWSGMKVEEFGFGFPPRLFGIKRGETTYSVNLIPLGGFVKILGESGESRDEPRSFTSKSKTKRVLVLVAGVVMNFAFAWVLISFGFMSGLPSVIDDTIPDSANVTDASTQITYVLPDSPAQEAGFELGDRVLAVNSTSVLDSERARELIGLVPAGQELAVTVERDGATRDILVAPRELEEGVVAIGTQLSTVGLVSFPPHVAIVQGANATVNMTILTAEGFWKLISRLAVGDGVDASVAGPVGIATMTGEIAALGFGYLIHFTAVLSINLAILNILPFPALDGGRIVFLALEAIRRKPVTAKIEGAVHGLGFALLMLLVILVTYRDIIAIVT